jgi:uncharacterized protein DUF4386
MTLRTNARVAGFAFLIYIAAAFPAMVLSNRAMSGEGTAAKLANIAQHASEMRLAFVLELVGCFCALVLAVTLYAITRDFDPNLAMLVLVFRTAEGVIGAVSLPRSLGSLWLATAAVLLKLPGSANLGATFFAVGSTVFAYLLLRGRLVPAPLSWLGLLASILVVVILPLQLVEIVRGPITEFMWLPMLAFEVLLALWLIIKGVRPSTPVPHSLSM